MANVPIIKQFKKPKSIFHFEEGGYSLDLYWNKGSTKDHLGIKIQDTSLDVPDKFLTQTKPSFLADEKYKYDAPLLNPGSEVQIGTVKGVLTSLPSSYKYDGGVDLVRRDMPLLASVVYNESRNRFDLFLRVGEVGDYSAKPLSAFPPGSPEDRQLVNSLLAYYALSYAETQHPENPAIRSLQNAMQKELERQGSIIAKNETGKLERESKPQKEAQLTH